MVLLSYEKSAIIVDSVYLVSTLVSLGTVTELALKVCELVRQPIHEIDGENIASTLVNSIDTKFKYMSSVCLTICGIMWCTDANPFQLAISSSARLTSLCVIVSYLLLRDRSLSQKSFREPINIESLRGLDYGSGMAHSYYHSYLRLILPSTGRENKGLLEKMGDYEDREGIEFASKKLFILIPSSSYIPPDLKEASDGWMEAARELKEEMLDRCGVKRRRYQNSVYKIRPDGPDGPSSNRRPVYVVAEGATPVFTFFEVQKHSHPRSLIYRKHRTEIIQMFYSTLQDLLQEDPQCRDICELLYYNDDDDSADRRVNVAKVILQRIQDIKERDDFA